MNFTNFMFKNGNLPSGGACGALGGGGAYGAMQVGAYGAHGGASRHCAADEDETLGSGDTMSMPCRKTYRTRHNVLINLSLGVSSILPSIRD